MRIGIDARLYAQTGVGRYIKNLLMELPEIDTVNEYIVYLRTEEFDVFTPPTSKWQKKRVDIRWHSIREQLEFPGVLNDDKLDLAHFPYFNVPIFYRKRYLLTIHDLIIDHFDTGRASTLPYPMYKIKRFGYKAAITSGIKHASAITTISQTTKNEIIDHYAVDPSMITVTYDALDEHFKNLVDDTYPQKMYDFRYILYVGNAYPHKNLERLLQGFKLVLQKFPVKLVFAGNDTFFYPRIQKYAENLGIKEHTVFYGMANDTQLLQLYSGCEFVVFPSLMEGFGLPTFEALWCNRLAVVSDIPVFRELWQNDLVFFDPQDVENIAHGLIQGLTLERKEYEKIILKAKKRIHTYSWKDSAKKTLEIYKKITQ